MTTLMTTSLRRSICLAYLKCTLLHEALPLSFPGVPNRLQYFASFSDANRGRVVSFSNGPRDSLQITLMVHISFLKAMEIRFCSIILMTMQYKMQIEKLSIHEPKHKVPGPRSS